MAAVEVNPYDQVLYPSYSRLQSHPDRLATIGRLLGMSPAKIDRCRVLELGCGNGSNLGPIAFNFPNSQFVGVDLAATPIANAKSMAADLGLQNIEFHQKSITEITEALGQFDYIICHGVFSWVPDDVREAILRVCRENLAPNGIAFVSYNAYPGNRVREMIREMMLYHVANFESPGEQIDQAFALAGFVAAAAKDETDTYRKLVKEEMETFLKYDGNYVFHDALAEYNMPFYFFQFMGRAHTHQLQYLGEADFQSMLDIGLPAQVVEKLDELSGNRIAREQYLDFIRCRRFRQTLLCHQDVHLDLSLKPSVISEFNVAGLVRCLSEQPRPFEHVMEEFESRLGIRIRTDSPLGKIAFLILQEQWPHPVPFEDLHAQARERALAGGKWKPGDPETEKSELQMVVFRSYASGIINLHTFAPPSFRELGPAPKATLLARWQAQRQVFATTLFHGAINLEDQTFRQLLVMLDGTRDRAALLRELEAGINARRKKEDPNAPDLEADPKARTLLAEALELNLAKLNRMGLIAG